MSVRGIVEWWVATVEPLRWRKHRRQVEAAVETERLRLRLERQRRREAAEEAKAEREAERQRLDREAQMSLIESLFDNLRDIDERRSGDLKELAAGVSKQAEGFQEWIKLFAQTPGDPRSTTVRDQDEWLEEQKQWAEQLKQLGYPVAEDPLEQLAFVLNDEG